MTTKPKPKRRLPVPKDVPEWVDPVAATAWDALRRELDALERRHEPAKKKAKRLHDAATAAKEEATEIRESILRVEAAIESLPQRIVDAGVVEDDTEGKS